MINSKHTLGYCHHCSSDMVICNDCGNNCCNGGTGEIEGKPCGCEEAYTHLIIYINDCNMIKFAKDIRPIESLSRDPVWY